uniref:Uncharacterized protein n=1 Tax=Paramormyrops kingsleyae TaxID=1676925 RepID=A0A3B3RCE9_9TELE
IHLCIHTSSHLITYCCQVNRIWRPTCTTDPMRAGPSSPARSTSLSCLRACPNAHGKRLPLLNDSQPVRVKPRAGDGRSERPAQLFGTIVLYSTCLVTPLTHKKASYSALPPPPFSLRLQNEPQESPTVGRTSWPPLARFAQL